MKRLALFAAAVVLSACSAAEKAPVVDSAAAAAPAPEAAPAMAPAMMDSTKKDSAMAPMAGDTTKKM